MGSYQYGSVVVSITLALMVIGLFGLLLLHTSKLTNIIQENVEMQVYLDKDISDNQRSRIENEIATSAYVLQKDNEPQVSFISKEEAAKQFIEDTGEDFSEFLGDNPLRDALTINIDLAYQNQQQMDSIAQSINQISGVFEVDYVESLVSSINDNLTYIGIFLLGFAIVLLIVIVILISSTIKLALFSQRFLIRSMQLVGATSGFIRRPFLSRSFLHGAVAGILASAALFGLLKLAYNYIPDLAGLDLETFILALYGVLVVLGGLIAYLSTARAMNKYLKMSLDELY